MRAQARVEVRFHILGPLTALRDGEAVALGGERQRALLAVLLVHAGELVSTEQLIDQGFGGARSQSASNAVHVAVSRLRRVLGDGGSEMLVTRRGGYVLSLGPDQLDAATFERLFEEGRVLLARGDPAGASNVLSQALRLWRGPPLADLPAIDVVQPHLRRLEELRLLAEMERIDAELALGHAGEAVVELERLVTREPLRERLRAQLMLALYRSGRQAEALAAYRETCELLREELGLTPGPELREIERMILCHDGELEAGSARVAPIGSVLCPFKGLAAFESSDAEFFCGRNRVISELIARLAEWPLVGILGPSGIGKSSLLRAGVLPALKSGALPGSSRWRQVLLRPGDHPIQELDRALGADLNNALKSLGSGRLVLAVDQLEELFTLCDTEAERSEFLARIVDAARDHERRVLVLCTLRADFYGRLSGYPDFAELLSRSHALVGPMDRDELAEVIEQPAARAGLEVERRLVDGLVAEVEHEPGGLPLLSTTLLELWQARDGHMLRLEHYRATGGVRGAVARIAEAAYMRLSDREQGVARNLLLRLADVREEAPERRRVTLAEIGRIEGADRVLATLTDARLVTVGAGAVELSHEALLREWPRYRAWLEEDRVGRRVHAHLRVAAGEWDARGRDPGELYRGARLAAALDFSAQHADQMDRLEREFVAASRIEADRAARRQRSQNRRLRALLIGAGVLLILTAAAGVIAVVGQRRASVAARLALTEAHAALGRQLGAEALNESRLDVAALLAREAVALDHSPQTEGTLLSVLLRSPAVTGTVSLSTDSAPHVAVSPDGTTLAVSDSTAHAVRFYDAGTGTATGQALSDFRGDQPPAYSADGSLIVYPAASLRSARSFLLVRSARTLAVRERLAIPRPFSQQLTADVPDGSIVVAPDGHTVYYAYWLIDPAGRPTEAYLSRWSLPSGRQLRTVRLGVGPLLALRLIDNGAALMVVGARDIATYDAYTARLIRSQAIRPVPVLPTAAAISPDGARVAVGSNSGAVSFVDAATGAAHRAHGGHSAAVAGATYSPDGSALMTAGDDGTVIVWNPATGTETNVLTGAAGHVRGITLSPPGSTLYTAAVGGAVLAWDLTKMHGFGRSAQVAPRQACCEPGSPPAPALALSPDGSRFATPVGPSTVGVFSTATLRRQASFAIRPGDETITALAWSPTGASLAVGAPGDVVQLWSVSGPPRLERSLGGLVSSPRLSEQIQALAFSPDGTLLAASDKSQPTALGHRSAFPFASMAIWSPYTGQLVGPVIQLGAGDSLNGSDALAFSPDGQLLAATLLQGGVRIFDPSTGRALRTLADPSDDSVSVAFAPNGTLAAGTVGGTVQMWDPNTGRRVAPPLLAAPAPITSVAFDPTGRRFATAGYQDGSIKLWSTSSFQQEGPRLVSDPGATSAAAFGPAGTDLLAVDDRGAAATWPMSLAAWEQHACSLAGRTLTRAIWAQFAGGLRYPTVCPAPH